MRITDRFRSEHGVFVEQLDVPRGLLDGGAPIDAFVAAELRTLFDEFERTLRGHIIREDEVLFPMAERALGDDRLVALDETALGVRA